MKDFLIHHYKKYDTVTTYFYTMMEDLEEDYKIIDDIIYIKGKECYVPSLLIKTIKTFELFEKDDYDYIVRTNVSTIINYEELIKELIQTPIKFYGGGLSMNLQWTADYAGITDDTWFGTTFITGTSIIFSKEAFRFLLNNKDKIRLDIIDDVSLGIFFKEHAPTYRVQTLPQSKYYTVPIYITPPDMIDINRMKYDINTNKYIFYRNRCYNNREIDLIQMKFIIDIIENKI